MNNQAFALTSGGGTAALTFWGLHIADIAVIISTIVSVIGVMLQVYAVLGRRIQTVETKAAVTELKADAAHRATSVLAEANRAVAAKVDKLESDAG